MLDKPTKFNYNNLSESILFAAQTKIDYQQSILPKRRPGGVVSASGVD